MNKKLICVTIYEVYHLGTTCTQKKLYSDKFTDTEMNTLYDDYSFDGDDMDEITITELQELLEENNKHKENTVDWHVGDIVIHDSDPKDKAHLMRVTKRHPIGSDGKPSYVTEYIDKHQCMKEHNLTSTQMKTWNRWLCDQHFLHDPKIFGLKE